MDSMNASVISRIANSQILENVATAGDGAGIRKNGTSPLNILASVISRNRTESSNGDGGGIFFNNSTSDLGQHSIRYSTISDNVAGAGGGIFSEAFGGEITIENSAITGNRAFATTFADGAGVHNEHGEMKIFQSTISGNRCENDTGDLVGSGGGIHNNNGGKITVRHATIAFNAAREGGGFQAFTEVDVSHTLLLGNTDDQSRPSCGFQSDSLPTIADGGGNFVDEDTTCPAGFTVSSEINLGALADNGGPTQTHALVLGSAAIDAAGNCGDLTDQRGVPRTVPCDAGAFETGAVLPVVRFVVPDSTVSESNGGANAVQVVLDNTQGTMADGSVQFFLSTTGTAAGDGIDYQRTSALPIVFQGENWPAPGFAETLPDDRLMIPDALLEGNETVVLTLSDSGIAGPADLGAISEHTVTILDGTSDLSVEHGVALVSDETVPKQYNPGDVVRFTVAVTNNGPDDAADVTVETFPDEAAVDMGQAVFIAGTGVYDPVSGQWAANGTGQGTGFPLAAGATETLTIEAPLLAAGTDLPVSTAARISHAFLPEAADPVSGNDAAVADFTIAPQSLILTGVFHGPFRGGLPRFVELYATDAISDLSRYAIGVADDGGGGGPEFSFPRTAAPAGAYLYVASEERGFNEFFGYPPDFASPAITVDGADAVELYRNRELVDAVGDVDVYSAKLAWEYTTGWAYRKCGFEINLGKFDSRRWYYSGPNALSGETFNAKAAIPFPEGIHGPETRAGDVDRSCHVGLADAIIVLKILTGNSAGLPEVYLSGDVDMNGRLGLPEALFVLRQVAF
jgi:hypothetical protein